MCIHDYVILVADIKTYSVYKVGLLAALAFEIVIAPKTIKAITTIDNKKYITNFEILNEAKKDVVGKVGGATEGGAIEGGVTVVGGATEGSSSTGRVKVCGVTVGYIVCACIA